MTAPDVNADVRARFEADFAQQEGLNLCCVDGRYTSTQTRCAWNAYRAAHADLSGEVRELVEADREYDAARSRYEAAFRPGPYGDLHAQMDAQHQMRKAKARRSAALAKFHPTHQGKP